jgi:hypothetical protein
LDENFIKQPIDSLATNQLNWLRDKSSRYVKPGVWILINKYDPGKAWDSEKREWVEIDKASRFRFDEKEQYPHILEGIWIPSNL